MKTTSLTKTVLCVIGMTLVPLAFSLGKEKNSKQIYELPTYTKVATLPEFTHAPVPQTNARLIGLKVDLKLTVNEKGEPESVRLAKPLISYSNIHKMTFASQMRDLVADWEFEPALNDQGRPVEVKVILPVEVVEKAGQPQAIAKLILDRGKGDRS